MGPQPQLLSALLTAFAFSTVFAQQPISPAPDAKAIMAQVAANQDRSEAERAHYVDVQHARVTSRKGKTVHCEEITDSRVVPTETGSHQELLKLDGRLLHKGTYTTYTMLPAPVQSSDPPSSAPTQNHAPIENDPHALIISIDDGDHMDRDLVENIRSGLTNDQSRDGLGSRLFPLTSNTQLDYQFQLVGREAMNGHAVFHVTFLPKVKSDYGWKGDAFIDTVAFQPILVRTVMSRKIPFAVRTLLGTSLPGLGFTVMYAPQLGGIWFPISFGTEFKMHVLFFLNREITINAENHNFEKTHVSSTIIPLTSAALPHQ